MTKRKHLIGLSQAVMEPGGAVTVGVLGVTLFGDGVQVVGAVLQVGGSLGDSKKSMLAMRSGVCVCVS